MPEPDITISIHAPAWGATIVMPHIEGDALNFNPRARVGRDVDPTLAFLFDAISIHAPAWGATSIAQSDL